MSSLRSIVSATDFSAPSRHAAWRAASLAQASSAGLTLMHAVRGTALDDLRRWLSDSDVTAAVVEDDARRRLHEMAEELGRRHAIPVQEHLAVGHPVEEVTRHAEHVDAGLLVTGTRGAGFFRGVVTGSTAERVARRSSRPVLMVRQAPAAPYRCILVPVDFSPWGRASIELARQLAPQATLVLMHAVELPYEGRLRMAGVADAVVARYRAAARHEAQQRLHALAADAGLDAARVRMVASEGGDPWMLIVQQEQEHECDLVVMGKQGRSALGELLLGSTTRMVISDGAVDVLICSRPSG